MTIALIGFADSHNDRQWPDTAGAWLARHDPAQAGAWASARREVFDLREAHRRNFLDDCDKYDVVVPFAIYYPPAQSTEIQKALGRRRGQTPLAASHSRENCAARLSRTGGAVPAGRLG